MNGLLWAAVVLAVMSGGAFLVMAWIGGRSRERPDDWAALIPAFGLFCLFGGLAVALAVIGLLAKVLAGA